MFYRRRRSFRAQSFRRRRSFRSSGMRVPRTSGAGKWQRAQFSHFQIFTAGELNPGLVALELMAVTHHVADTATAGGTQMTVLTRSVDVLALNYNVYVLPGTTTNVFDFTQAWHGLCVGRLQDDGIPVGLTDFNPFTTQPPISDASLTTPNDVEYPRFERIFDTEVQYVQVGDAPSVGGTSTYIPGVVAALGNQRRRRVRTRLRLTDTLNLMLIGAAFAPRITGGMPYQFWAQGDLWYRVNLGR